MHIKRRTFQVLNALVKKKSPLTKKKFSDIMIFILILESQNKENNKIMSTNNTQIKHLGLENVDLTEIKTRHKDVFLYDDILIAKNISKESSQTVIKEGETYRTGEYRILKITNGEINITLNLNTVAAHSGDILYIGKGVLVQMNAVSNDTQAVGILFSEKQIAENIIEKNVAVVIHPEEKYARYNDKLFDLLWQTSQSEDFRINTILYLFKAYVSDVFFMIGQRNLQEEKVKLSHSEDIFKRFLVLADRYGAKERTISFYSDKLFISEKHLSFVVKKESGQTVKQWLNKQAVLEAKILLKHTDMTIYQVSDELNFPNPAFFTKFFKRLTGMTPKEFQKKQ